LREWLEENKVAYVVAVSCDHRVPAWAGRNNRADKLTAKVPGRGWQRLSCGPGPRASCCVTASARTRRRAPEEPPAPDSNVAQVSASSIPPFA